VNRDDPGSLTWLRRRRQERLDAMTERVLLRMTTVDARARPGRSLPGLAAALLVLPVHVLTVALAAGGLTAVLAGDGWVLKLAGALALALAVLLRPHLGGMPEHVALLRPEDAPALFRLLGEVGSHTRAPVPHVVVVSSEFNATASLSGLRRRVLEIGAPLWIAADPQARVALLGHELGHFAHGDLRSGVWVGSGFRALTRWHYLAHPGNDLNIVELVALAPLRWAIAGYLSVLDALNASASRRQEYLADLAAAHAGGTAGATALMDTLLAMPTVEAAMTRAALDSAGPSMWDLVRDDMTGRSDSRVARRRTESAERNRADSSHPLTTLRIRLLEARPRERAGVVPDAGTWAEIDAELADGLARAEREAADEIRYVR
jgi:Zn-dependent protease with chaperone function